MKLFLVADREYTAAGWASAFKQAGLSRFVDFWNLDSELVDEPNNGRGGESTISRARVQGSVGEEIIAYIKRQENYRCRPLRHPFRGIPTAQREFEALLKLRQNGVAVAQPLYFGVANCGHDFRAILITEGIDSDTSWQQIQDERRAGKHQAPSARWACLREIGAALGAIHRAGFRHTCFYPKHLLLKDAHTDQPKVIVLDLENAKGNLLGFLGVWKDLDGVVSRYGAWSNSDILRFLSAYCMTAGRGRAAQRYYYHRLRWIRRARLAAARKPLPRFAGARSVLFAAWRLLT